MMMMMMQLQEKVHEAANVVCLKKPAKYGDLYMQFRQTWSIVHNIWQTQSQHYGKWCASTYLICL